ALAGGDDGVARPELFLLIDEFHFRDQRLYFLGRMSDNDENIRRDRTGSPQYVFNQRCAPDPVQNLGVLGFHASAFAGGEDQNSEVIHLDLIKRRAHRPSPSWYIGGADLFESSDGPPTLIKRRAHRPSPSWYIGGADLFESSDRPPTLVWRRVPRLRDRHLENSLGEPIRIMADNSIFSQQIAF